MLPPKPKARKERQKMMISDNEPIFVIKGRKWKTTGKLVEEGFIVYKGSTVNSICECFKTDKTYYPIRIELEETGTIQNGVFTKDHIFKSPAQAGCVVSCHFINTNVEWKTDDEDSRMFGEVHPKTRGEKKDYSKPVEAKPKEERAVEGLSQMPDGTPRFIEIRNGMVYEYRGREAEMKARQFRAA